MVIIQFLLAARIIGCMGPRRAMMASLAVQFPLYLLQPGQAQIEGPRQWWSVVALMCVMKSAESVTFTCNSLITNNAVPQSQRGFYNGLTQTVAGIPKGVTVAFVDSSGHCCLPKFAGLSITVEQPEGEGVGGPSREFEPPSLDFALPPPRCRPDICKHHLRLEPHQRTSLPVRRALCLLLRRGGDRFCRLCHARCPTQPRPAAGADRRKGCTFKLGR